MQERITAVFSDNKDAEAAVGWLMDNGIPEEAISVVARGEDGYDHTSGEGHDVRDAGDKAADTGKGALAGAGVGAGVGALFGLAAVAIPGVGPFITAGAWAAALGTTGAAAASGAVVGATSGGLAGAFAALGFGGKEAGYYANQVEEGGTVVSVDTSGTSVGPEAIRNGLERFNANAYSEAA